MGWVINSDGCISLCVLECACVCEWLSVYLKKGLTFSHQEIFSLSKAIKFKSVLASPEHCYYLTSGKDTEFSFCSAVLEFQRGNACWNDRSCVLPSLDKPFGPQSSCLWNGIDVLCPTSFEREDWDRNLLRKKESFGVVENARSIKGQNYVSCQKQHASSFYQALSCLRGKRERGRA